MLGTLEDWRLLHSKVQGLAAFFGAYDNMSRYLMQAATGVSFVFQRRDPSHWKEFFAISRCHSGHTDVVEVPLDNSLFCATHQQPAAFRAGPLSSSCSATCESDVALSPMRYWLCAPSPTLGDRLLCSGNGLLQL